VPEQELNAVIDNKRISTNKKLLEEYSQESSLVPGKKPGYIVKPSNSDEIQAIIRWANETRTPLVPVSSGKPHYHGGTVPAGEGAIIVDLSGMKRIIKIDSRHKYAIIEPGVTFGELQSCLNKEGLFAYTPLAPRSSKSVVAAMLEREPVTMPAFHWDSTDPLLCAEVVFGTGDKLRTGEASGPDTIEEQWKNEKTQMNPFGHGVVDFQRLLTGAQGTIGIVTWASLKCGFASTIKRALLTGSQNPEPLIELCYKAAKYRLGGHLFILNRPNLACLLAKTEQQIRDLRQNLPPWVLFISFEGYGPLPEEKVLYEEKDFRAMAISSKVEALECIGGARATEVLGLLSRDSLEPYWKTRLKKGFYDLFFQTTLDKTPGFEAGMRRLAGEINFPPENIGVYIQPLVQGTSCHCEFNLYFNPDNPEESKTACELLTRGAEQTANTGAFFSRPYPVWKEIAYRKAAGTAGMQKKVKQIFDPNGILNPGKLCF